MSLPELLPIQPFTHPVRGEVTLPGSKSITNRALLLAALCDAPVTLTGALFSEDTHLMAEALRKLGFTVEADEKASTLRVGDQTKGFTVGEADLFVGLAGTAARFLTALCAAAPGGVYRLRGVPQMHKRPMRGLIDALRQLGADIRCTGEEGFFPLEIHARRLRGGTVSIDASESSQMLSALFMVAPFAEQPCAINLVGSVRWPFVHITVHMQAQFGITSVYNSASDTYTVPLGRYLSRRSYSVEPDATAASYFLALPLVTKGRLFFPELFAYRKRLQGDSQFADVLSRAGANIIGRGEEIATPIPNPFAGEAIPDPFRPNKEINSSGRIHEGIESIYCGRIPPRGVTQDFSLFSDTFLTLAAIAPLLTGKTAITGIAHTRKQETDRVAGMARELIKLGQDVVETEDSLTITPRPLKSGVEIETYHDHRFAMSFGILGCHDLHGDGRSWLSIRNPACCAKTFPHFFELLESLRKESLNPPNP